MSKNVERGQREVSPLPSHQSTLPIDDPQKTCTTFEGHRRHVYPSNFSSMYSNRVWDVSGLLTCLSMVPDPVSEVWRTMWHSRTRLCGISVSLWPSRTCCIKPHEDRGYHDTGFATCPGPGCKFLFPECPDCHKRDCFHNPCFADRCRGRDAVWINTTVLASRLIECTARTHTHVPTESRDS